MKFYQPTAVSSSQKSSALLTYTSTLIQEIKHPALNSKGVSLFIKREDLNHPTISGNKWWKLKYNLEEAERQGMNTVLTFGGAYSNHIYATAAAAAEAGLSSIGIIRGEETKEVNPTLQFAAHHGMYLHFISRESYRNKTDPGFIASLQQRFGNFYLIPEGGTNAMAVKGCAEFAESELSQHEFDQLFLAVGTGGTMAGLICGFKGSRKITGIPVLKNAGFLENEIRTRVSEFSNECYANWSLLTEYHHGGYAKTTPALLTFIQEMQGYRLPLDHVYTAKALWAIFKEAECGNIERGEKIMMLHTGGLQGSIKLP